MVAKECPLLCKLKYSVIAHGMTLAVFSIFKQRYGASMT